MLGFHDQQLSAVDQLRLSKEEHETKRREAERQDAVTRIETYEHREAITLNYARYLKIDVETEHDLLWIPRKALTIIPIGWEVLWEEDIDEEHVHVPYFHNPFDDVTTWVHPEESKYLKMIKDERKLLSQQIKSYLALDSEKVVPATFDRIKRYLLQKERELMATIVELDAIREGEDIFKVERRLIVRQDEEIAWLKHCLESIEEKFEKEIIPRRIALATQVLREKLAEETRYKAEYAQDQVAQRPNELSNAGVFMNKGVINKAAQQEREDGGLGCTRTIKFPPETWKAFWCVGVLFPFHIILGVAMIPVTLYYLFIVQNRTYMLAVLLYAPFYLYPAHLKYPGWKGNEFLWTLMDYANTAKSYFGEFEVHGGHNIKNKQGQYCIACHPHGTVIFQRTFWRCDLINKIFQRPWRMLAASVLFKIPVVREMTLWFGAVDASKSNCERFLKGGASLVVYPGGLDEANLEHKVEGVEPRVILRTRTGFIRLALKYNTPVVPVFTFGELDAVDAVNLLPEWLSKWMQKTFRMSTTIFLGRFCTFIPYRVPFNMCIGREIPVKHCPDGTPDGEIDAEVVRVHALYKAELKNIYDSNKKLYGYENRELIFLCDQEKDMR